MVASKQHARNIGRIDTVVRDPRVGIVFELHRGRAAEGRLPRTAIAPAVADDQIGRNRRVLR